MQTALLQPPSVTRTPKSARLPQIDYWRGLCLILIYVHHLPLSFGGNFTISMLGFCDAVIVFVFLSGFVCRLAFGSALEKQGWGGMIRKALRRAGTLMLAHLAMTAFAVVAIVLYHKIWPGEMMLPDIRDGSEEAILAAPLREIGLAAIFKQHAWLCHVLPLYTIFILSVPLLFALERVSPWLLLAISGALWAAVRLTITFSIGGFLHETGFWLNPFAWQFAFVGGFVLSSWVKQGRMGSLRPAFFYAGVGMLLFIAATKLELYPRAAWFFPIWSTKGMCDFSYVAYFALLALVLSPLVSDPKRLARWPAVSIISIIGQKSLTIWVGTEFVVYTVFFLRRAVAGDVWVDDLAIGAFAVAALWLLIRREMLLRNQKVKLRSAVVG
ncbi:MAG TPA: OpgC domain-containing protein [Opitutaceae bacterium]|nr:OpgC domain-containing protein [Opitutaceae bacterium]